jgi:hypothetical protein
MAYWYENYSNIWCRNLGTDEDMEKEREIRRAKGYSFFSTYRVSKDLGETARIEDVVEHQIDEDPNE